MAITTSLQPKYTIQKLFVVGLCVVLGLWGVYDYVVKIPAKARTYERGQIVLQVKQALEAEPGSTTARTEIEEASNALNTAMEQLLAEQPTPEGETISPAEAVESVRKQGEEGWLKRLLIYRAALIEASRRTAGAPASETFAQVYELVKRDVSETADVSPPSTFDRATQWMFILCLPFAPYYLWSWLRDRRRVYRLEDDGTLHTPTAAIPSAEIADIDMSKWMRKSIAEVVTTDGTRIKLDDYVYRDMHRIVGALAVVHHPEDWDENAKRRATDTPDPSAAPSEDEAETPAA
ncbi:MAG: hypothetical protein HKO59_11010 [Phycisphaerales bacterium]|nr:hypothetical protein [Phycisphaerae bacterium]NNF44088.1 hypothetical protein [Phycisphaerales bacterium]NNM26493.1 hypothetical protein [Phycisphaerales bacterium]